MVKATVVACVWVY